jgi:hypothetical protein
MATSPSEMEAALKDPVADAPDILPTRFMFWLDGRPRGEMARRQMPRLFDYNGDSPSSSYYEQSQLSDVCASIRFPSRS